MEILNEIIKQQQQIQKELETLNKNLSQENKKAPVIRVDSHTIVDDIKNAIPKTSDYYEVSRVIKDLVDSIPREVKVKIPNSVWGFTDISMMIVHYSLVLILIAGVYAYCRLKYEDQAVAIQTENDKIKTWIQDKYPKVFDKMPDFSQQK